MGRCAFDTPMPSDWWDYISPSDKSAIDDQYRLYHLRKAKGETISKIQNELNEEKEKEVKNALAGIYYGIIQILKKYVDIPENYYKIIALWIIGTYVHDTFETFPLLFINACKGSGKSRLLKLIIALSRNGKIVLDLKEAPLFRTATGSTLGIDEFENVGSKDNATIRTLINAAYKKGARVERMKKVSQNGQEKQVVECFDLYCSVVMANIWGMDEVVSDRCLQVILDKSANPLIVKLIEDFTANPEILDIKRTLEQIQCSLCSVVTSCNIIKGWNNYITTCYKTTLTTYNTYTTTTTLTTPVTPIEEQIFNKINETKIDGRNLELFFPLFIISNIINEEVFEEIIQLSSSIIQERKNEEYTESKDVSLMDFVSGKLESQTEWKSVNDLAKEFRNFVCVEEEDSYRWLNSRWMGRALKRNKLILQKRRMGKGVEVLLDVYKAKDKLRMFKEEVDKNV